MAVLTLPLIPLRDMVLFPHMVAPLFVGRKKSIRALTAAMEQERRVFLITQTEADVDDPEEKDLAEIGCVGRVLQLLRLPDGTVKALVEGEGRARMLVCDESREDYGRAEVEPFMETGVQPSEAQALMRAIMESYREYANLNRKTSAETLDAIAAIQDPAHLSDAVSAQFSFKIADKQQLLETEDLVERMLLLVNLIRTEAEIFSMDQKIRTRVKRQMEKNQRHYYLNEQIRAIRKEMGDAEDILEEIADFERRLEEKQPPEEAVARVRSEIRKLKMMPPMSAEATVVRNYVDWILALPWNEISELSSDLDAAEGVLDKDHYGLEKPKERILEYLAVQTLVQKIKGPILCLVGPPGVGKTSLARSVARATGRKYVRLSLGGVRDEAEIRGHRRTYIGAMPGKIIQSLKKVGTRNPVFCLDEVDKMSMDFRGDPSAALLEVLDPEQNATFSDHYLDLDCDLSEILFITTANTLHNIPLPLQDRMEIIRIPGYTEIEKYNIAIEHLIPKQVSQHGLELSQIHFTRNALYHIIRYHTREAGVRNLERQLAAVCRKVARDLVRERGKAPFSIDVAAVRKYLGVDQYRFGSVEKENLVGTVTGLAWTQVGGELLTIETVLMPGKGEVTVTGKLGDVMKESARAAMSYVRFRSESFGIDPDFYKEKDLHIHFPEGAIPKDGPSAGIAICTALVSSLTGRPVDRNVAMTGEITLRGRALPIGGLREKVLAAHRGGIVRVLYPAENEKDIKEIPASVLKKVRMIAVSHMDEVLELALLPAEQQKKSKKKK
ncbi:endopeptidase La [Desulfobotulus mexicanus]|uniref:Lon protease n=1 Tax=Desulfobotulus mexicanus TaxID=2586642 RepID=A0A5Q4VIC7_9BACT|nr:endopeptidase La [Desulfobotulus mexicanus]TYT76002.1 endopeptidase La [Desulfobotulus mexicanus]